MTIRQRTPDLTLQKLWDEFKFTPNAGQREAIEHIDGPLLLTAGPGSGKTRVLLWRTLNLIVFHGVPPREIFLTTLTEKAARQLKDGLRQMLGYVTNQTGENYDLSEMALGTVHSICQQLLTDRRFSQAGKRQVVPRLMDSLGQYFYLNRHVWSEMMEAHGFARHDEYNSFHEGHQFINNYLDPKPEPSGSKHYATLNLQKTFNRFSEEMLLEQEIKDPSEEDLRMLSLYNFYCRTLREQYAGRTDFSRLQHEALKLLRSHPAANRTFRHVIVDEYQDTNTVQEALYFLLSEGSKNLCVVGDDDQALYRFRGATVENLVEFSYRCEKRWGITPQRINLQINYRSRRQIVDCYTRFMVETDWRKEDTKGHYRVMDKGITAFSTDDGPCVATTSRQESAETVFAQIAATIKALKQSGKIQDYNQVACLFPSLKSRGKTNTHVDRLRTALASEGIPVYAPRAGRFLEVEEAEMVIGLLLKVFNMPPRLDIQSAGYASFVAWLTQCRQRAEAMIDATPELQEFIRERRTEWKAHRDDYAILEHYFRKRGLDLDDDFDSRNLRDLSQLSGLSAQSRRILSRQTFSDFIRRREKDGNPFDNNYIINRLTTLDWSVLDLFYQLMGFPAFKRLFDLAEQGEDEGPVCNLSLMSGYLARYMDEYQSLITGRMLHEDRFQGSFFNSFCYALYRLDESEYENPEDPFPKGRVPFLTIHQSKGLEFPVVVLGNLYRRTRPADTLECKVRELLDQREGEPLDRMSEFDNMRLFYVAMSRAENLLLLPQWKGSNVFGPLKLIQRMNLPDISELNLEDIPAARLNEKNLGQSYSYTGDYLSYLRCSRFYMIFRKYDFAPARSQSMFFGNLVHRTIEDLHLFLLDAARRQTEQDESIQV